jgi:hypothetical protein
MAKKKVIRIYIVAFVAAFFASQVFWFEPGTYEPIYFGWMPYWLFYFCCMSVVNIGLQWAFATFVWKDGLCKVHRPELLRKEWVQGREHYTKC